MICCITDPVIIILTSTCGIPNYNLYVRPKMGQYVLHSRRITDTQRRTRCKLTTLSSILTADSSASSGHTTQCRTHRKLCQRQLYRMYKTRLHLILSNCYCNYRPALDKKASNCYPNLCEDHSKQCVQKITHAQKVSETSMEPKPKV